MITSLVKPRYLTFITGTILAFVLVFHLAQTIASHIPLYATTFNYRYYENMYGQSQYVLLQPLQVLPDEYLYSLAAWKYTHGENPALFNADQPPLGKYIVGLGIHLFGNEKITTPLFVVLTLTAFFFLCLALFKNVLLALAATTIFSFEKLLLVQMLYAPLLDIYQLFFIMLALLFIVLSFTRWPYLIAAMVAIGCVMGTKYFATGVVILVALYLDGTLRLVREVSPLSQLGVRPLSIRSVSRSLWQFRSVRRFVTIIVSTPLTVVTLLLIYLPAYWHGYTPRMILGVQRYIFEFHSDKIHFNPLDVWQLLLLNRWHVPWDDVFRPSVDWQLTWTIMTIGSVVSLSIVVRSLFKNIKHPLATDGMQFICIWTLVYLGTLMMSNLLPRYVMPLLPALYILTFALAKYGFTEYRLVSTPVLTPTPSKKPGRRTSPGK